MTLMLHVQDEELVQCEIPRRPRSATVRVDYSRKWRPSCARELELALVNTLPDDRTTTFSVVARNQLTTRRHY